MDDVSPPHRGATVTSRMGAAHPATPPAPLAEPGDDRLSPLEPGSDGRLRAAGVREEETGATTAGIVHADGEGGHTDAADSGCANQTPISARVSARRLSWQEQALKEFNMSTWHRSKAPLVAHHSFLAPTSCGCLPIHHPLRQLIIRMVCSGWFNVLVLVAILANCVWLALETDVAANSALSRDTQAEALGLVGAVELCFVALFTLEAAAKVTAFGFAGHPRSYLHDAWNQLDFAILLVSYATLALSIVSVFDPSTASASVSISAVSVMRALRVLRPLRTLSRVAGLRVLVRSLLKSVWQLGNVLIVFAGLLVAYSVIGLHLWRGTLDQRCYDPASERYDPSLVCSAAGADTTPSGCAPPLRCERFGSSPEYGFTNFDHLGWALLVTFRVCAVEGWTRVMAFVVEANGYTPFRRFSIRFFFMSLVVLGSLFVLNLMVAVLKAHYALISVKEVQVGYQARPRARPSVVKPLATRASSRASAYGPGAEAAPAAAGARRRAEKSKGRRRSTLEGVRHAVSALVSAEQHSIDAMARSFTSIVLAWIMDNASQDPERRDGVSERLNADGDAVLTLDSAAGAGAGAGGQAARALRRPRSEMMLEVTVIPGSPGASAGAAPRRRGSTGAPARQRRLFEPSVSEDANAERGCGGGRGARTGSRRGEASSKVNIAIKREGPPPPGQADGSRRGSSFHVYGRAAPPPGPSAAAAHGNDPRAAAEDALSSAAAASAARVYRVPPLFVRAFFAFDRGRKGYISCDDLCAVADGLGLTMSFTEAGLLLEAVGAARGSPLTFVNGEQVVADGNLRLPQFLDSLLLLPRACFRKDQIVFAQGDEGTTFYVILTGEVRVVVQAPTEPAELVHVAVLGVGQFFGEMALLGTGPATRTATVQCTADCELIALSRKDFVTLLRPNRAAMGVVARVMNVRESDLRAAGFYEDEAPAAGPPPGVHPVLWACLMSAHSAFAVVCRHPWFERLFALIVLANTALLASEHVGMDEDYEAFLEWFNVATTFAFTLEVIVKVLGFGPTFWVRDRFNIFDAVVAVVSLFDVVLTLVVVEMDLFGGVSLTAFRALAIMRVARLLRVMRVVRVVRYFARLQRIIKVILQTLVSLGHLFLLLLLFVFIFTVLGQQLFGGRFGDEPPRANFDTFPVAAVTVFQLLTLEDWDSVLFSAMRFTEPLAALYFIVWIQVGAFVLLNFLLAIILGNFEMDTASLSFASAATDEMFRKLYALRTITVRASAALPGMAARTNASWVGSDRGSRATTPLRPQRDDPWSRRRARDKELRDQRTHAVRELGALGRGPSSGIGEAEEASEAGESADTVEGLDSMPGDGPAPRSAPAVMNAIATGRRLLDWRHRATRVVADGQRSSTSMNNVPSSLTSSTLAKHHAHAAPPEEAPGAGELTSASAIVEPLAAQVEEESQIERVRVNVGPRMAELDATANVELPGGEGGARHHAQHGHREDKGMGGYRRMSVESVGGLWETRKGGRKGFEQEAEREEEDWTVCARFWRAMVAPSSGAAQDLVVSGTSCGCLDPDHPVRRRVHALVRSQGFDIGVLVLILVNCAMIVVEIERIKHGTSRDRLFNFFEWAFTVLFTVEMALKIVAFGFIKNNRAYLRNSWNILDFLVVVLSWTQLFVELAYQGDSIGSDQLAVIQVLRVVRALRPLRVIARFTGMRLVVNCLLQAMPAVGNLLLVMLLVWLVFGILGVQLFKGSLHECTNPAVVARHECVGTWRSEADGPLEPMRWVNSDFTFDHIGEAMLTLYVVATLEGWVDIMWRCVDSVDEDTGRVPNARPGVAIPFFIAFVCISAFFLLALFTGVIYDKFYELQQQMLGTSTLTVKQRHWLAVQYTSLRRRPGPSAAASVNVSNSRLRKRAYEVVRSQAYLGFVLSAAIVNSLALGLVYQGARCSYNSALMHTARACGLVYLCALAFQLAALQWRAFIADHWNRFDLAVVLLNVVEVVQLGMSSSFGHKGEADEDCIQLSPLLGLTVVRLLGLLRVRRMANLRSLFRALYFSLPSVLNIGLVFFVVLFVFAILGMSIMPSLADVADDPDSELDYHTNFDSFGASLVSLFRFALGEDWHEVMYYARRRHSNPGIVALYFVIYSVLASYVLLTLFVSFVVQNYSDTAQNYADENQLTDDSIGQFVDEWHQFVVKPEETDWIREEDFGAFLVNVGPPLGAPRGARAGSAQLDHFIFELSIPSHGGYLHFNEVLYALARKAVGVALPDLQQKRELRGMQEAVFPSLQKGRHFHLVADSWAAIKVQQQWRKRKRLQRGVAIETQDEKNLASKAIVMRMMLSHDEDEKTTAFLAESEE